MATHKVMVIDDDECWGAISKFHIENSDPNVEVISTPFSIPAFDYLSSTDRLPDLIILDWNLPGLNGKDILTLLKTTERYRYIPVIVMTCSDRRQDSKDAIQGQAASFLVKSQDMSQLINIIKNLWTTLSAIQYWREQPSEVS